MLENSDGKTEHPALQSAGFNINYSKPFRFQMVNSDATGHPLLKLGAFGADLIRFEPGKKVGPHTHPGSHILVCLCGRGLVWYNGEELELEPGVCYLIPEFAPHAVYAHPESVESLVLMAIGNDHRIVDSKDRLDITDHEVQIDWK
jgi:quercetin dioxygenase-like cupin family protein